HHRDHAERRQRRVVEPLRPGDVVAADGDVAIHPVLLRTEPSPRRPGSGNSLYNAEDAEGAQRTLRKIFAREARILFLRDLRATSAASALKKRGRQTPTEPGWSELLKTPPLPAPSATWRRRWPWPARRRCRAACAP